MCGGRIEPHEERFAVLTLSVQIVEGFGQDLGIKCLHALPSQWSGVLDLLLTDAAEFGILRWVVHVSRPRVEHPAGTVLLQVLGVLLTWVIELLRLFLCIQMIEITEPFIEAMHRWQMLVAVA